VKRFTALPKDELFESLRCVIVEYPCEGKLRQDLLDVLYELAERKVPGAKRALVNRFMKEGLGSEEFVERLRVGNETMMRSGLDEYVRFVEEWRSAGIDENLVRSVAKIDGENADCDGQQAYLVLMCGRHVGGAHACSV